MKKKIQLTEWEDKVLTLVMVSSVEEIKFIPIDLYYTLLAYCEQEEDYVRCIVLRDLETKITDMTCEEYYKLLDL